MAVSEKDEEISYLFRIEFDGRGGLFHRVRQGAGYRTESSRARFRGLRISDPGVLSTAVMAQQAPQVVDVDDRFGGSNWFREAA